MKNIPGGHIQDKERSIDAIKNVCAKSKSECCKAKAAFENEDEPVGACIETAVNILNNVIEYVDE